ncbi:hypothetical protein FVEG_15421 [Fusarium verticillioides 7600]|uniref:Uncharacterized protein n=1 Tax=Gibberella moniliformis (strain M3125 / FGSC 7600) TaxID=334819 RepID=W7LT09_GIBM7|nr:hypothetical protein FVEG_15421 [Fusarium verticillioides 7600]EWG42338.1 hypothetical protein FVEG_15421 [Fusarium verticillioides 7600]
MCHLVISHTLGAVALAITESCRRRRVYAQPSMIPIRQITNIGFGSLPLCRPGLRHFSYNSAFRKLKIFSATTSEGQDPWRHCQSPDTYLLYGNTSRSINCFLAQLLDGGFMAFDTVSHVPKSHILSGPPVWSMCIRLASETPILSFLYTP